MNTPSKPMFEHWRTKGREAPALPFWRKFQEYADLHPNDKNLRNVFLESVKSAEIAMQEAEKRLHEIPVFKWADKQSGFVRAVQTVGPNLRKKRSDNYNWAEEVIKHFSRDPEYAYASHWLEKMFSQQLGNSWSGAVFRALDEYYFSNEADELYKIATQGPRIYKSMIQSIEKLLGLMGGHHDVRYEGGIRRLERVLDAPAPSFENLPIKKNSQHKAEQLFVYRVWLLNQQTTGKPKAEAIVELMTLDGFKHEFDKRTVERMCARFKAAKLHIGSPKSAVAEIQY